jgi:glutamate dehydrogenase
MGKTALKTVKPPQALTEYCQSILSRSKITGKKELSTFAGTYFKGLPLMEYDFLNDEAILGHIQSVYSVFNTAWKGEVFVRVHNPPYTRHTVAEVHMQDQPFLVDSVWSEIHRRGLDVHHTFHPVFLTKRTPSGEVKDFKDVGLGTNKDQTFQPESLVHIEFDRIEDDKLLRDIKTNLENVMHQARAVSRDFPKMTAKLQEIIAEYDAKKLKLTTENREDAIFLKWLIDGNFVFLGYRHYDITHKTDDDYLGMTKGTGLGILSNEESSVKTPVAFSNLAPNLAHNMRDSHIVNITKGLAKSPIHRRVDMDYIGIKQYNKKGVLVGEHRFMGLFTSKAYTTPAREIPIVRQKIQMVLDDAAHQGSDTHNFKALANILETYPKDELFQITLPDLMRIANGIVHLSERQKVRMFARRECRERLVTVMVFIPRDRMSSTIRKKIIRILLEAYDGEDIEYSTTYGESMLTRLFFKIRTKTTTIDTDDNIVERLIIETVRSWDDSLRSEMAKLYGDKKGSSLFISYKEAFREGYKENTPASIAAKDVNDIEAVRAGKQFHVGIHPCDGNVQARMKVFRDSKRVNLSDIMPILDNMGLFVNNEQPNRIRVGQDATPIWMHEFGVSSRIGGNLENPESLKILTGALEAAWQGTLESDTLNGLIVASGMTVRQIVILRSFVAYLKQVGGRHGSDYVRNTLIKHAKIAKKIVDLFDVRMTPENISGRQSKVKALIKTIEADLAHVSILDEDTVLRRIMGLTQAILRTNAWQRKNDTDTLCFKLDSTKVPGMPAPAPMFEIFVYDTLFEGVHLRGGKIARGGLRWSDRHEDFRTEILGLMKTQMTKNSVIVPLGAKGGFIIKHDLPKERGELMKVVETRYSSFVTHLLSITDNLIDGKVVPPREVKRHDGDDPYLVVAADKGTATFSDIANGIAEGSSQYWSVKNNGFWLGDAFASGGSNGYDHKKMGITARGAWECVKHHFRTLGTDIQTEDFTCVAIGDMAGDVFGNGMLLSKHTCLVAAFNHMHIFIDPTPHAAKTWKERNRLFHETHSQWSDYNTKLISKGGGVFSRHDKSIDLTKEMKKLLGINKDSATPDQIIRAILTMKTDLLWNGGIGTFIKGKTETNADASDRANDQIRINGDEVGAKVFGEGGNLGSTQLGRIEFARNGGLINTDAIDNSAGVDCSDNEVNIKILLNTVREQGKITDKKRSVLLEDMTDAVAKHVLRDNYLQAQILTIAEQVSTESLDTYARLTRDLEKKDFLDRDLEFLPSDEEFTERAQNKKGLTRPELSVLMAYVKMDIFSILLDTDTIDDKALESYLFHYFPEVLRKKYTAEINGHRLKREIVATVLSNELVNRMGLTYTYRMVNETGSSVETIAKAHIAASRLLEAERWYKQAELLDNKVSAEHQRDMLRTVKKLVEAVSYWLIRNATIESGIQDIIDTYKGSFTKLEAILQKPVTPAHSKVIEKRCKEWMKKGLPKKDSDIFSKLPSLNSMPDISKILLEEGCKAEEVTKLHFALGETLKLGILQDLTRTIPVTNNWERVAVLSLVEAIYTAQRQGTRGVMALSKSCGQDAALKEWESERSERLENYLSMVAELKRLDSVGIAHINSIIGQLRGLTAKS